MRTQPSTTVATTEVRDRNESFDQPLLEPAVQPSTADTFLNGLYASELKAKIIQPAVRAYSPDIDITTLSLDELTNSPDIYNRELSWLDFNWRVLQEALDQRTPLLERLRFLAITADNLDEFIMKRVGGLKRQQAAGVENLILPGWTPDYQLSLIAEGVRPMMATQSACLLDDVLPKLAEYDMRLLNYDELSQEQQAELRDYYVREVYPILTPLAVDSGHPFPFISNLSMNLAVLLKDPVSGDTQFARLKVPQNRPRWVQLKNSVTSLHFIPLEQVIIHNLDLLFTGMEIVDAYPFRVTRNADLARDEDVAEDLLEMISEELRERRFAPVVRLEVDEVMPSNVRALLQSELGLDQNDVYSIRGPLGLRDLFALADVNLPTLKYAPWAPLTPPRLAGLRRDSSSSEIFSIIRQNDLLVHHPYFSFPASTQQFIEFAARDPQVMAIKQTLYRTDENSPVIRALIHAAEQGKQVAVLVELKARFDEARNIQWARRLENAGCHVAYGLVGLKTHAKVSLVIREEEDGLRTYFHIGTGNYNAKTSSLYTDMGLLSCQREIGADLMDLFNFLTGYSRQKHFRKLLVAPINMRQRFLEMIDVEIENAVAGKAARIMAQMNSLEDPSVVRKLYEASQAGVAIDVVVRGNCRLRPGLPGISENIRVVSVIGRFLEHARLFYFENNGSPRYFMGSADWMVRNLSARVEAIVPIENKRLQEYILYTLQSLLADQRQAWDMLPDGRYCKRMPKITDESPEALGTHEAIMRRSRMVTAQLLDEG